MSERPEVFEFPETGTVLPIHLRPCTTIIVPAEVSGGGIQVLVEIKPTGEVGVIENRTLYLFMADLVAWAQH